MPQNRGLEIEAPRKLRGHGVVSQSASAIPEIPWTRLTQRPRPPRDQRMGWLVAVVVLVVFGVLAWQSRGVAPVSGAAQSPILVRFIGPTRQLQAAPELAPPPPLAGRRPQGAPPRIQHEAPAKGAIQATIEGVEEPPLKLYGANGQVRLPPSSAPAPSAPGFHNPGLQGSQIYHGKSPVPYKKNPFNQAWAPLNESLGARTVGRAVDKAIEKTTVVKTLKLPGGIKIRCGISPLALAAGCGGEPPPPPPSNDSDIRLSMPPPESLTGKKVAVPSVAPEAAAAFGAHPAAPPTQHPANHQREEPCPLESKDAQTSSHPRDACREREPLPAGGRS